MKVIALVTLEPGSVPPGEVLDIKDKAEAVHLIERGLAAAAPAAEAGKRAPTPVEAAEPQD